MKNIPSDPRFNARGLQEYELNKTESYILSKKNLEKT